MVAAAKAMVAVVAVAALAVQLAAAADHPVGGDGAWDASGSSYDDWSAKQKFGQGDTVSFKYASSHDVTEVTKAGYDACSGAGSNTVKSYTGGATTVKLAAPGKRYFICSVPGHCAAGMKLEVTVAAAAPAPKSSPPRRQRTVAPAPAPEAPAVPSPSTDDGLPTVSSPVAAPAPKSSDASSVGMIGAKAAAALAVGMALALAI